MNLADKIYSKLRREVMDMARNIDYHFGAGKLRFDAARGSRILIYHGICQRDHTRFNPIFLTRKIFEAQLKLYKRHFNPVSLDDFYAGNFSNDRYNICLTFDDGFANNYKYVLPLLAQYQIPATFFITAIRDAGYDILWNDFLGIVSKYGPKNITYKGQQYYRGQHDKYIATETGIRLVDKLHAAGFAEKAEMMELLYPLFPFKNKEADKDYWLQMTVEQIRELAACPYATVGAHGCYHNDLAMLNLAEAGFEMGRSKAFLEDIIQKPVKSLAFPYGSYTQPVVTAAKTAGYSQLLAMDFYDEADHHDPTLRERLTVNPFISPVSQVHANISRSYD